MGNYLTEKVKAAFTKKWVQAFLIAALLSTVAVSIFYSKDRWASIGVVGTWITGAAAVSIAYRQRQENHLRKQELIKKSSDSINHKITKFTENLGCLYGGFNSVMRSSSPRDRLSWGVDDTDFEYINSCAGKINIISISDFEKENSSYQLIYDVNRLNKSIEYIKRVTLTFDKDNELLIDLSEIARNLLQAGGEAMNIVKKINPRHEFGFILEHYEKTLQKTMGE